MDLAFYFSIGMMVTGYLMSVIADKTIQDKLIYKIIDTLSAGLFIAGLATLLQVGFFFVVLSNYVR